MSIGGRFYTFRQIADIIRAYDAARARELTASVEQMDLAMHYRRALTDEEYARLSPSHWIAGFDCERSG
jgi:hypothetical protein